MSDTFTIWVVTKHPSDYPDKFVARANYVGPRGASRWGPALTADTLEEARSKVPIGLYCMPRSQGDDPVVVEVWL